MNISNKTKLQRVMKIQFILTLSMLIGLSPSCSQELINYDTHAPRLNDVIYRSRVEYLPPGDSGNNVIWDFRNINVTADHSPVEICCDSDSIPMLIDSSSITRYELRGDSLLLIGRETELDYMKYDSPLPYIIYPFAIGDSISNNYTGHGSYCKKMHVDTGGTFMMEADGTGSIILADGDTLQNAIRLHSINVSSKRMYLPDDSVSNADLHNLKQEVEERYIWYARGYRYPILETISISCYDDMEQASCQQTAYSCLPDGQCFADDSVNAEILLQDSLRTLRETDIIHYKINVTANSLIIDYSLDEYASINALICNDLGMVYGRKYRKDSSGVGYQLSFDISNMRPDNYILYLNVNGRVYSEKFNIR